MGYMLMYCVVFGGYDECLKIMFSWFDGDLNVVDFVDGWIFVYFVVWKGYGVCFKLLFRKGGRLCECDFSGKILIFLVRDLFCLFLIVYYLVGKYDV